MDYDRFVTRVRNLGGFATFGDAVAAIRSTLTTLGERLTGEGGRRLATHLPHEIALQVGWPSGEPIHLGEFYERVALRAGILHLPHAASHARIVMQVVDEALPVGEVEAITADLPEEFGRLLRPDSPPQSSYAKLATGNPRPARASELMTEGVITVKPDDSVAIAACRMHEFDCGSLPVVEENGRPVGVITDRDIALFIAPRGLNAEHVQVVQCMTDQIVTCRVDDSVERCLSLMARHQIRRLPVVNEGDRLVGILSQADLARHAQAHSGHGERRQLANLLSAISEPSTEPSVDI
jgi:CBS domain-containing protein/uncharacterized protein (DUF2267 family)